MLIHMYVYSMLDEMINFAGIFRLPRLLLFGRVHIQNIASMNILQAQMQLLQFWHTQGIYFSVCVTTFALTYCSINECVGKCRYDMEDAMILNKSSVERGMFHGQIYQV